MSSSSPHPFTLRQLQYVVAVAEELSFHRAAARCHVSQPSLSTQLAQVEEVLGVRIFERQGRMLHSKAGVFDDGLALIGSGNLDPRSFRLNLELNLAIHHVGVAGELRRIFENYRTESVEIQAQTWARRPWWRRAYEQFAYQFRWLL